MTKIKVLAVLFFTATVLLIANAQQRERPRPWTKAGDEKALNDAPQKKYPLISLEQQKAAVRRVEEMRRKTRVPRLREKTPPADWIQSAYHGLVLDANFDVIELTPDTVSKIQESIFSTLQKSARGDALRKRGGELGTLFNDKTLKGKEKLAAREAALEGFLAEADEKTRLNYEWRLRLLRRTPVGLLRDKQRPVMSKELAERLKGLRVLDLLAPPEEPSEYVRMCRAEGVPIPPDWPDARWVSQGLLGFVFITTNLEAEVFAYKDPAVPGACYALPRRDGTSIEFLGIICQSATTGKACFWDNRTPENTPLTGPDLRLDIDTIANGLTLAENCTECHRGDNVFNIHPGTALDLSRDGAPGGPYFTDINDDADGNPVRYTPIGQPHWNNPEPLVMPARPAGQRSCTSCHTLPKTSPDYCAFVLQGAAMLSMPPFGPDRAGWPPSVDPDYATHIQFLSGCP